MLKGHVFSKQIFENPIFALWIDTLLDGKCGIGPYGQEMKITRSGNTITVADGTVCVRGRFIEEDTSTPITAGTDNAYCILVIEIDLDKENTESELNQVSYKIVKGTSSYPNLTQTDIVKNNAGIYQYELARFRTGSGGITDFQDKRTFLDFNSIYTQIQTEYRAILDELQEELDSVEDGSAYRLKGDFAVLTGTITMPEANDAALNGTAEVNYPSGFNKDNCVVVSILSHNSVHTDWWATPTSNEQVTTTMIRGNGNTSVVLKPDKVSISSFKANKAQSRDDVSYKITLMKV